MEIIGWLIFLLFAIGFFWFWIKIAIYIFKMFKSLGDPPEYGHYDDIVGDDTYPWHEGPP